ncbi:ERF family protein [Anaerotignum sp.]
MKKEFIEKIARVQKELKAPKSKYNSFGNYNYRSTEDILEAAKPLLSAEGLVLNITDKLENIGERYYVKATAAITDGEDSFFSSAYARECAVKKGMDESQITGSASTYARKYALNGLFCIDDTKDADTDEQEKERSKRAKKDAEPVYCTRCGKQLKEEIKGSKVTYTAQEYFDEFGGLCPDCYIADYAAKKNAGGSQ